LSARPDPRVTALGVLTDVHQRGAYANLALPLALGASGLDERDRAFVTELVYGSLRREGELDVVIANASDRAVSTIDSLALDILRLGVYQILHLRVPNHAAVDQSVRTAKAMGAHRTAGFINAVLRKVISRGPQFWEDLLADNPECVVSHPAWIAQELDAALALSGLDGDLHSALHAHNESPLVSLVCLPGFGEPTKGDTRTRWSPLGIVLPGGNPGSDDRVASGRARVQDEGSQLAALLLTRYAPLGPQDRILDMCAGPGGKTAVVAAEALIAGARVEAMEKIPHRVELVRDSTRAVIEQSESVLSVSKGDARELHGQYSRILLDAPCSGLGALRRRPEARWAKSPDQLVELTHLQAELLDSGLSALLPGGVLAYVTCSPVVSETSDIVAQVLSRHPEVELINTSDVLNRISREPLPHAARGTAVQLWTYLHGTDAMFIQLLRRRNSH
jgi:16S rRNA (cytosine967-C5)-methyltransferase